MPRKLKRAFGLCAMSIAVLGAGYYGLHLIRRHQFDELLHQANVRLANAVDANYQGPAKMKVGMIECDKIYDYTTSISNADKEDGKHVKVMSCGSDILLVLPYEGDLESEFMGDGIIRRPIQSHGGGV